MIRRGAWLAGPALVLLPAQLSAQLAFRADSRTSRIEVSSSAGQVVISIITPRGQLAAKYEQAKMRAWLVSAESVYGGSQPDKAESFEKSEYLRSQSEPVLTFERLDRRGREILAPGLQRGGTIVVFPMTRAQARKFLDGLRKAAESALKKNAGLHGAIPLGTARKPGMRYDKTSFEFDRMTLA